MAMLLRPDYAADHELERPTGRSQIFSIRSPVPHGQKAQPRLLTRRLADKRQRSLKERIGPLLEAREQANRVYNSTYFENHYPVAEEDLKSVMHEKIMNAHSRLRAEGDEPEERSGGITIVLNIGGNKGG